jgi:Fur family transcriptional regulator, peroxide stress response regulator
MAVEKAQIDRRIQAFVGMCRASGMKVTHQRMEVFRELAASVEHPDAETVYQAVSKRIPSMSRDTVYRTLAMLEAVGLVHKVEPLAQKARYDANLDRHHHFVCKVCGRVSDFYSEALNVLPIPKAVEAMGVIDSAHVEVRGKCSTCAGRPEDLPPAVIV